VLQVGTVPAAPSAHALAQWPTTNGCTVLLNPVKGPQIQVSDMRRPLAPTLCPFSWAHGQ
jgi:hypothetical protein